MQTDLIGDELRKLTGHTRDTRTALKRELTAIRKRGYALEKEEAVIGGPALRRRSSTAAPRPSAPSASPARARGC